LLRRAENADQKQKGRDDLEDESREHIVLAEVTWAQPFCPRPPVQPADLPERIM
jgi:hypothetical protein